VYISSCSPPPDLSHKECIPPPPPDCRPGLSTKVGIDTAHIQPGDYKYHIDLLPGSINSNGNENAITFFKHDGPEESILSAERDGDDGGIKQRILASKLLTDLHFEKSTEIKGPSFEDVGAAVYCNADQNLYFTAKAPNDDPNDFDLYSAKLKPSGAGFELVETMPLTTLNKTVSFDGQPAVSRDGLMIVFASDRAGGSGGVDLWYSSRSSIAAQWGEPHPLPKEINTPCDELSPSFSADGKKLFFSSDGHETIGGYDIFSSEQKGDSWSKAENLGTPINTKFDEIFPYQLSDSQFFYTSNQPVEFKGRNIFALRRTYIPPKNISERKIEAKNIPDSIQLKGTVELPPDSILPEVFVRDVQKDKEIARKSTDTAGRYSFRVEKGREYDVGSEIKDKFYDVHRVDLRKPADSVIIVPPLAIPDTLILRINFPFDDDSHPYDYTVGAKGEKTEMRWQTSLDLLAKSIRNSSLNLQSVILYGHTDSLGSDEYNFDLAKRRASFIARQLKARGIPSKLLAIVSEGRTMPVTRTSGESDETFQLRCRRVEFVKVFKKDNMR
ncbi:MAG: OmpA family protein, partial [Bacteroidota bacterium]|nr:OmpA family protein [Bacteroidota bacterium]